jgi:hypothetical protein
MNGCCNCSPTAPEDDKYTEWRVDDAFRTIKEAEKIKQDPKMMGKIQEKLDADKKAIRSIEDLRKVKTASEDDE